MKRIAELFVAALVWGSVLAAASAQPPQPQPEPQPPQTPPLERAQQERAEALLDLHAARSRGIAVLVADYVQRRTTALSKEPLESRGEFLFVRDPGVVVFRATAPRQSVTRLSATTYEVWRPQKKQLERFHLDGPELANGLFAALGGDAVALRAGFAVVACTDDPAHAERVRLRLVPKAAAVRARLQELEIVLLGKDAQLAAVAYRDASGDRIEIELNAVRIDPKDPPPAALDVPADATVVEHRAKTTGGAR
jgi:hypothetical protein